MNGCLQNPCAERDPHNKEKGRKILQDILSGISPGVDDVKENPVGTSPGSDRRQGMGTGTVKVLSALSPHLPSDRACMEKTEC